MGYMCEVSAHWVSSYFRSDPMRLPSSPEEAIAEGERASVWMRRRYPNMISWINESYSTGLDFWTYVSCSLTPKSGLHYVVLTGEIDKVAPSGGRNAGGHECSWRTKWRKLAHMAIPCRRPQRNCGARGREARCPYGKARFGFKLPLIILISSATFFVFFCDILHAVFICSTII